ncbi:uncharacterized protein KY384_007549 [Bacidia gigantensis]|uniref:uncharacterized protein n=1 Tax=Bacidia gigantensis TaxID=2732470 RepID=UPI001D0548D1|nr:uncharacterized protein KY384_007549 [Bacidia gigantensis]KAG8527397.1 hypothetical protein KY384_007549 [Bacidia gigantensis]
MEFMSSLQSGFDEQKPSLFEILSENQLAALIPPSLRYLLTVATYRRPRYLLRVLNSYDELYALLMLMVERHYLSAYGGGFTENFYGLKREKVLRIKGGEAPRAMLGAPELMRETLKLSKGDVWKNLAIMVGIPYLKRKLDESHDIHAPQATILGPRYNRDTLPHDASIQQRILYYYKWFLRKIYPSINAAYYFSLLAFNLAYLFDNTKYSSPFLWLIGTRIRRLNEADYRAIALASQPPQKEKTPARPGQGNSILNPTTLATTIYPRALSSLKILLPTSIFALKFLEWWHASDFAHQLSKKATEGLDLPPPIISGLPQPQSRPQPRTQPSSKIPQQRSPTNTVSLSNRPSSATVLHPTSSTLPSPPPVPPSHQRTNPPSQSRQKPPISSKTNKQIYTLPAPTKSTSSVCPICLHEIQTPTSAQTGFVYCYTCIFKWVEGRHERQLSFMGGGGGGGKDGQRGQEGLGGEEGVWDDLSDMDEEDEDGDGGRRGNREGKWESGAGRCAITGRRVLGGVDGLRRVMV